MTAEWEQQGRGSSARRLLLPAVLVLAGIAIGVVASPGADTDTFSVIVDEATTPSEVPAAVEDTSPGGTWTVAAAGPLSPRDDSVLTWAGDRVFVWGGRPLAAAEHLADGATYHPRRNEWERVARSPLAGRIAAAAAWTGTEVFVWGGSSNGQMLRDGATYDIERRRWRRIPRGPLSPRREAHAVAIAQRVVVWGGRAGIAAPHEADGAVFNPRTRRWRRLPPGPLRRRSDADVQVLPVGRDVVVWSASRASARVAAFNLDTWSWRPLLSPPLATGAGSALLSIDGSVLAWGVARNELDGPQAVTFTSSPDWWSSVASPPFAPEAGRSLVGANGIAASWSPLGGGVYFDEVANQWSVMAPHPDPLAVGWPAQVWAGDRLFVWHGLAEPGVARRALLWRPPDPWRAVHGSPVTIHGAGTAVWNGWLRDQQQLLVWGGQPHYPTNTGAAYDPQLRLWETMPTAPLRPRWGVGAAWDGDELLVVGGRMGSGRVLRDGAAYDPVARTWRQVPSLPFAVHSGGAVAADGAVYVAGTDGARASVAMLRDGARRWRPLPSPPVASLQRPRVVWTGLEVWLVETGNRRNVVAAGWDPARRQWRRFPRLAMNGPVEMVWGGRRVYVMDRTGRTASLGLSGQEWVIHPRSPVRGMPLALAWTGRRVVAYAPAADRMASLDPRAAAWANATPPPFVRTSAARLVWTGRNLFAFGDDAAAQLGGLNGIE